MQAARQLTKLSSATLRACRAVRAVPTMGARASSTGRAPVLVPKLTPDQASAALKRSSAVCFDVDSTVITTEGIDELGAFLGKAEEIAALTAAAMEGDMPFQDALAQRLDLLKPSRADVEKLLEDKPPQLTPGMADLVELLKQQGKQVFLVSGGFENMIAPVAMDLGVPLSNVFANRILFHDDHVGTYRGFDREAFTSRAGGKARAILHLKATHEFPGGVVMVGDGGTDYEARRDGAADVMVGYGGVITRAIVRDNADVFIHHWSEFEEMLSGAP